MSEARRVGFVGLGIMGKPMALNLVRAGFDVTVFSRSPGPVEEVVAGGARRASSLADLAAGRGDGSWNGTTGIASSAAEGNLRIGWLTSSDDALTFTLAAPGDVMLDNIVDVLDAATLLSAGRYDGGLAAGWSEGDFNYDDAFDIIDATDMLTTGLFNTGNYLPAAGTVVPVPEPGSAGWLAAVAAIAARSSGRRRARSRQYQPCVQA